jgi:hypothetical protein
MFVLALPRLLLAAYLYGDCSVMFATRADKCAPLDGSAWASCQGTARFYIPFGWAGYMSPVEQTMSYAHIREEPYMPGVDFELNTSWSMARPGTTPREGFDRLCPMFSAASGNPHCCFQPRDDSSLLELTDLHEHFWSMFQTLDDQSQAKIFPRCHRLIRFAPCAVCHPNATFLMFDIGPEGGDPTMPTFRAARYCSSSVLKIWRECRNVLYISRERHWIVPRGFGLTDFLKFMGHNVQYDGSVSPEYDIPGVTCLDLSEWDQFDAAGVGRLPSWLLLGLVVAAVFVIG